MPKLFILGAGFSKAISPKMPTLWELSQEAIQWDKLLISKNEFAGLTGDVEQLLSYLHQEMPWKKQAEFYRDRSAFFSISEQLAEFIGDREKVAFDVRPPEWSIRFAEFLHSDLSTVATLNYDTLVEQLATVIVTSINRRITESDLYRLPISYLGQRLPGLLGGDRALTFRLLKLHGSTNWFYSGESDPIVNSPVYYDSVRNLGYALLRRADIPQQYGLLRLLMNKEEDPLKGFLFDQFSQSAQNALKNHQRNTGSEESIHYLLVSELNRLLRSTSLYDGNSNRFSGIELSAEVRDLLSQQPCGEELTRLNRLLLEDVYQHKINNNSDMRKPWKDHIEDKDILRLDLEPLIIPPVAEKSAFYRTRLVKVLWGEFRKAIENADEIYCIGYSLPKTDLTMRLFLKANSQGAKQEVFIVNRDASPEFIENYRDVFKDSKINTDFLGQENAVELMVEHLVSSQNNSTS